MGLDAANARAVAVQVVGERWERACGGESMGRGGRAHGRDGTWGEDGTARTGTILWYRTVPYAIICYQPICMFKDIGYWGYEYIERYWYGYIGYIGKPKY